jgi:serine/threonine protein kinase
MPKTLSPVTISTLLKKAKKAYQRTPPNLKEEAELRHVKIEADLKVLRRFARQEETGADLEDVFEVRKLQCLKKLKVHRQKLRKARDNDPNKDRLPKYLEALGKLTLSVKRLKFNTLSDVEEANLTPDALEAESEEDLKELDVEETDDEAPSANGAAVAGGAALVRRLNALTGGVDAAVAAGAPNAARMQVLYKAANDQLEKQNYAEVARALDELEPLVRDAAKATPPGTPPPPPNMAANFEARLKALMPLVLAARQANPAIAAELTLGVTEASAFAKKEDYLKANARLNAVEKLLSGPTAAPSGDEVIQRFNKLAPDLKAHLAVDGPDRSQIQALSTAVSGLLKSKDYAQAAKTLDELEPLLRKEPAKAPEMDKGLIARCQALRLALEMDFTEDKTLRSKLLPLFESAQGLVMKGNAGAKAALDKFEQYADTVKEASAQPKSPVFKQFEKFRSSVSRSLTLVTTDPPAPFIAALEQRFVQAVGQADPNDDAATGTAVAALRGILAELSNPRPEVHNARIDILLPRLEKRLKGDELGLLDRDVRMEFLRRFEELATGKAMDPGARADALRDLNFDVTDALTERLSELTGFMADIERAEPHLARATALCEKTNWDNVKALLRKAQQDLDGGLGGTSVPIEERQRRLEEVHKLIKAVNEKYKREVAIPKYGANEWEEQELRATLPVPATDLALGQELGRGAFGAAYRLAGRDGGGKSLVGKTSSRAGEADLRQEEQIYARLGDHPNITKCYGMQQIDGKNMLVMKEIKGGELNKVCDDLEKKFKAKQVSREEYLAGIQHLIKGTLRGLAHFEELKLVHRDVKGDNIRYDAETGEPVLLDMGLAGDADATLDPAAQMFGGTAPPEILHQGSQRVATNVWDSFALGKMLFPLLEQLPDSPQKFQFVTGLREAKPAVMDYGSLMPVGAAVAYNLQKALTKQADGTLTPTTDERGNLVGQTLNPTGEVGAVNPGEYGALTTYVDFMNQLTHPDPEQRLKPSEALKHPFMTQALADGVDVKSILAPEPKPAPSTTPPEAPSPDGGPDHERAVFATRLKALEPRIHKTLGLDPELTRKLQVLVNEATRLAGQEDYAEAVKRLDQAKQLLDAPPPPRQRLDGLAASIEHTLAGAGADRARIEALKATAEGLLGNDDVAGATKVLNELEPLLKAPPEPGAPDMEVAAVCKPRFPVIGNRVKKAQKESAGFREEVNRRFQKAAEKYNSYDFPGAMKALDELEIFMGVRARLQAVLKPVKEVIQRDPALKDSLAPLLQQAQARVDRGDDGVQAAIAKLGEMVRRLKESGDPVVSPAFTEYAELRNAVERELEALEPFLPREEFQRWGTQMAQAEGLADPKDDGKCRAAVAALTPLQADLRKAAADHSGPRADAALARVAAALKGTDGGLLEPLARVEFQKRVKALAADAARPAAERLRDATALEGEVKKAVAERDAAVAAFLPELDKLKPLVLRAVQVCQADGRTALRASLLKKYELLETSAPSAISTLSPEAWKKQVAAFRAQVRQIADLAPARDGFLQRYNSLAGLLGTYLALGGPDMARVKQLAQVVTQQVQQRDYARADGTLNELEPLLQTPNAPPAAARPNLGRDLIAKFNGMQLDIARAVQDNPALADDLKRRAAEAKEYLLRKDFVKAAGRLNALEQVLGTASAAAPSGAEADKRFKRLGKDIEAHLAGNGPDRARIQQLDTQLKTLLQNGDFAQAMLAMDDLDTLVLRPAPRAIATADVDQISTRLDNLKARIRQVQEAQTGDTTLGDELISRYGGALAVARQGDLVRANAMLDVVDQLLTAAAAADAAPAAPAAATNSPAEPDDADDDDAPANVAGGAPAGQGNDQPAAPGAAAGPTDDNDLPQEFAGGAREGQGNYSQAVPSDTVHVNDDDDDDDDGYAAEEDSDDEDDDDDDDGAEEDSDDEDD